MRIEHDGHSADVDGGIASLLLNLWRLDCWTVNSCQDNVGKVWIEFANGAYAEQFVTIVAGQHEEGVESLYNRVVGFYHAPGDETEESWDAFWEERAWDYKVHPHDLNLHDDFDAAAGEWSYEWVGPADVVFSVSVRFPLTDLAEVERRVRSVRP